MTTPLYPAVVLLAVVCGWAAARLTRVPSPLSAAEKGAVALGAFVGAFLGAKLPWVLTDWEGLRSGAAWLENGKTILFGLVGGYAGVEAAKWSLGVTAKTGDSFAVAVPVSVGVGRWACVVGGCCYGLPTTLPWGVDFGDGVCRHPTQIYESAFHLCAAGALLFLRNRGLFRGQLIKLYFLSYFAYRFATEFIRPEPEAWLGLTFYQWGATAFAALFAALWAWDARPVEHPSRVLP